MDSNYYDNKKLSEKLDELEMNNYRVAELIGKNYMTVRRARAGKDVSFDVLTSISSVIGVSVKEFIYDFPLNQKPKSKKHEN